MSLKAENHQIRRIPENNENSTKIARNEIPATLKINFFFADAANPVNRDGVASALRVIWFAASAEKMILA